MPKRKGKYYVNNKELLPELAVVQETGEIPEKLHLMFYDMAKKIGTKPRFSGYTWIDDMISDAYLKCCVVAHKFNSETTQNPFGYFTSVIINHFWDALNGENKQKKIKEKFRDNQISMIYHRYGIQFNVGKKSRPTDA